MTKTSYRSLAAAGLALTVIGATASAAPFPQKPAVPATDFGYDLHYAGDLGAIVAKGFDLIGPAASSTFRGIYDLSDDFGGHGGYGSRYESVEGNVSKH